MLSFCQWGEKKSCMRKNYEKVDLKYSVYPARQVGLLLKKYLFSTWQLRNYLFQTCCRASNELIRGSGQHICLNSNIYPDYICLLLSAEYADIIDIVISKICCNMEVVCNFLQLSCLSAKRYAVKANL